MRKRGKPHARLRALPTAVARGIHRAERERKADVIARPMRDLFALLLTGEVHEIDGQPVMRMPDIDERIAERAEWCAIGPAILGWIDCWRHIAPDLCLQHMRYLADRLDGDKAITPRLVEQAREEFEQTIARIPMLSDGVILSAITTSQIGWEMERVCEGNA